MRLILNVRNLIWKYGIAAFFFLLQIRAARKEICVGEEFQAVCSDDKVILVDSALYGRMKLGRCVQTDYGHLGCQNDVKQVLSGLCSVHQRCEFELPGVLMASNKLCPRDLSHYLEVEYHCLPVITSGKERCDSQTKNNVQEAHGYISSHITTQTGCGSPRSPWIIDAKHGQNIQLKLLSFGDKKKEESSLVTCSQQLGFIEERTLNVNKTICKKSDEGGVLYKSKTNMVEISILTQTGTEDRFLIEFSVVGCPEISPPAQAWYKREGDTAEIVCKNIDKKWQLRCEEGIWRGTVGNCTQLDTGVAKSVPSQQSAPLSFSSIILLTGVICAAVLLIIVVVVAGTVYIKKQSIKHSVHLRSEYGTATLPPGLFSPNKNPGYDTHTFKSDMTSSVPNHGHDDNQPLVHIWERTLPDPAQQRPQNNYPVGTLPHTPVPGPNTDLLQ